MQIVVSEAAVDAVVAADYNKLVVPVVPVLSQTVVHMCCLMVDSKSTERAVPEEDIGHNFAGFGC